MRPRKEVGPPGCTPGGTNTNHTNPTTNGADGCDFTGADRQDASPQGDGASPPRAVMSPGDSGSWSVPRYRTATTSKNLVGHPEEGCCPRCDGHGVLFRHGVRCLDPFHEQAVLELFTHERRANNEPETRR
jgi:hypothetical protein